MARKQETTAYDDVFRTQIVECPGLILPVINEIFHKNYTGIETIAQSENEIFLHQQGGIEYIFEKKLHFLLPFRIFVYEDEMELYEEDDNQREVLIQEFIAIRNQLQDNCEKGIIDEFTKCMLIDMSKKVIRNLLKNKFPKIREGAEKAMGGKVLNFEAKIIRDQGRKEGRQRYLIECICKKLRKRKDILTIAEELEEEVSIVEKICEIAKQYAPEYDIDKILAKVTVI